MKIQRLIYYLLTGLLSLLLWPTIARAQTETTYIHGNSLQPLVEAMGDTQTLNIYEPGGRLITQVATNSPSSGGSQTRYLLHDHLGSTRVVVDGNNQMLGRFDYTPFGQTTATNNGNNSVAPIAYRYTGQQQDSELETYNYHARFYDPAVGRFDSVDSARQFASSYLYVGNNPINGTDPTGSIYIRVDAETFAQLQRASRAIEFARSRVPFAGNVQADIDASQGESIARATIGTEIYQTIIARQPPRSPKHQTLLLAATGSASCGALCDAFSSLTTVHLLAYQPDASRPILRVKSATGNHSLSLIGDPAVLSPEQVVVADAWFARPQAVRLSDINNSLGVVEHHNPGPSLAESQIIRNNFEAFESSAQIVWQMHTGEPATRPDFSSPNNPANSQGRRIFVRNGAAADVNNFVSTLRTPAQIYSAAESTYNTIRPEAYNYVGPDGSILSPSWHTADLFGELPFATDLR